MCEQDEIMEFIMIEELAAYCCRIKRVVFQLSEQLDNVIREPYLSPHSKKDLVKDIVSYSKKCIDILETRLIPSARDEKDLKFYERLRKNFYTKMAKVEEVTCMSELVLDCVKKSYVAAERIAKHLTFSIASKLAPRPTCVTSLKKYD